MLQILKHWKGTGPCYQYLEKTLLLEPVVEQVKFQDAYIK